MTSNIAILQVENAFNFIDTGVDAIEIAEANYTFPTKCDVAGWGSEYEWGVFTNRLQGVEINVQTDEECQALYGTKVDGTMCCAGDVGKDACLGDLGGPLTCDKDGNIRLGGIVSWNYGCGREGYPGVYTKVSVFNEWITDNTPDPPV